MASLRAHRPMRGPTLSPRTTAQTGSPGRENAVDVGVAPALWGSEPGEQLLLWDARPAVEERRVCITFPQTTPWRGAGLTPPVPTRRETSANGCCGDKEPAGEPGRSAGLASPLLPQSDPPLPGPEGSRCVLGGQERAEHQHKVRCSRPSTCTS